MSDVIARDGRYPPDAFSFLREGMNRAVEKVHGPEAKGESQSHVTGAQVCQAMRDLAIERWGMLAKTVLAKWRIHATIDFGNMVYLLIEHSLMRKTPEDSVEDFRDVYDFDEAFGGTSEFELKE